MDFHFKLNLQRIAKLSIATFLWQSEEIETKVKKYFYKHDMLKAEDEWTKITKSVIELLHVIFVRPVHSYTELICIIKDVGLKIHDWFDSIQHLVLFSGMDRKTLCDTYMRKIYWTHYGAIDGLRILKESWMNIPVDDAGIILNMACLYCLEDDIPKLWKKIPQNLRETIHENRDVYYNEYSYYMLLYWLESHLGTYFSVKKFNRKISSVQCDTEMYLNKKQSPEVNMLIFSAYKGYSRAVRYFWENITPKQQKKYISDAFDSALIGLADVCTNWPRHIFRKEQFLETCVFLMNQWDKEDLEKDLKSSIEDARTIGESDLTEDLTYLFLNLWPWTEKFSVLFDFIKPFLTKETYNLMFATAIEYYNKDLKNPVYQQMLRMIWQSTPDGIKIAVKQKHFDCLFKAWDLSSLKMLFNDPCTVKERKARFMKFAIQKMIDFSNNNEAGKINEFIDEVLLSDDDVNKMYCSILKCDVENLSNFYSNDNFKDLKTNFDPEIICKYFISKSQFHMADQFLKWRLSKNQVRELKFKFRDNNFTREHIYDIWIRSKDVKEAENKSNKFLNWFLNRKEFVGFKKNYVIRQESDFTNEKDLRFVYNEFVQKDRFEMIEHLTEWCGIEEHFIEDYREHLIKDVLVLRILHYLENNQIDMGEKFFKWAFPDGDSRKEFVQDLIDSDDKWLRSLKRFIANLENENLVECFNGFINFWIKPTECVNDIKRELISWKKRIKKLNEKKIDPEKNKKHPWLSGRYEDGDRDRKNFDKNEIYCSDLKIDLFLSALHSMKSSECSNSAKDEDEEEESNETEEDETDEPEEDEEDESDETDEDEEDGSDETDEDEEDDNTDEYDEEDETYENEEYSIGDNDDGWNMEETDDENKDETNEGPADTNYCKIDIENVLSECSTNFDNEKVEMVELSDSSDCKVDIEKLSEPAINYDKEKEKAAEKNECILQ